MNNNAENNEVRIVDVCTCWGGYEQVEANGTCGCGSPTWNGEAAYIECWAGQVTCEDCGQCHCVGDC